MKNSESSGNVNLVKMIKKASEQQDEQQDKGVK